MGTSSDRTGKSGGAWTPLKRAATTYAARTGTAPIAARRLLARSIPVLGGAGGATGSAQGTIRAAQRLGALLAGVGTAGLDTTLREFGLSELIGKDRYEVLDALITYVTGHGGELDEQAARDAACDVLELMFEDAETFEELEAVAVSGRELVELLVEFLAAFVCNRIPVLAERLASLDPAVARTKYAELRAIVAAHIDLDTGADPFAVDWAGDEGWQIVENAIQLAYEQIEALEEGGA
jgi:hypothetical protein